jgi:hypothetical protein
MSDPPARLSADERRMLSSVLGEVVPQSRDGKLPSAAELGVVDTLEQVALATPGLRPLIAEGLAALDSLARSRGGRDFAALPRSERLEALNALSATQPHFLPTLCFHTYVAYYREPRVVAALGLEPRPPYPKGHELEPGDLGLLDGVRRRAKMYREC